LAQGRRWADHAKKAGVKVVVWYHSFCRLEVALLSLTFFKLFLPYDRATLTDVKKISRGKYDLAYHQEKVKIEDYMKEIDLPAVFVSPAVGCFYSSIQRDSD
jgi:hypothetical protein